jgi:hypothetical protein
MNLSEWQITAEKKNSRDHFDRDGDIEIKQNVYAEAEEMPQLHVMALSETLKTRRK